jgi:lysophospholipase L1-like esterase
MQRHYRRAMVRGLPEAPRWAWVVMALGALSIGLLFPVAVHRGAIDPPTLPAAGQGSATTRAGTPSAVSAPPTTAAPSPTPAALSSLRADGVLTTLFFGDGISAGLGASAPGTAFPALVTARLQADGPVQQATVAGQGAGVRDAVSGAAASAPADLVVVEFGTNDLLQGRAQQFATDYPALLDAVRARSPNAVLLCAGTWAPASAAGPYDDVIRTACEAHAGRYVALSPVYEQPDAHAAGDETHPDDAGHRAIAEALIAQVRG